ncbi:exosome complex exonuclease Rrp41 [Candidatus Woesearchaeota archaeon]|nr:exosome complex exonuclease Rrp41 [Candidatus Woesearchaeota archaeon]
MKAGAPDKFIVKGKRLDGRKIDELRPIKIKAGVIKSADGSAYLEMGETTVLVAVRGPREVIPRHLAMPDKAYLNCVYDMMSFATPERNRPGPSRRSTEISKVMKDALSPAIFLEKYPKTKIDIYAEITNANAGTRCAAITAASVALADAGIEMKDIVASIGVGKAGGKLMLDLFEPEDNFGEADVPIAIMPRTEEITLLQMDGDLSKDELKKLIAIGKKACKEIYKKQKQALKKKFETEKEAKK